MFAPTRTPTKFFEMPVSRDSAMRFSPLLPRDALFRFVTTGYGIGAYM